GAAVIFAGRIDHRHFVLRQEGAERVHIFTARKLEGGVVEADVALAMLALFALRVGGGGPEKRLSITPARHVAVVVFVLEAEEAEQLAIKLLGTGEITDAEHQVIDADDAGHGNFSFERNLLPSSLPGLTPQVGLARLAAPNTAELGQARVPVQ